MEVGLIARVLAARPPLRRRERWSQSLLRAHQERALAELRAFAYARSPFYQRFHRGLEQRPLSELPVLTKAELMQRFDELVTDRAVRLADVNASLPSWRAIAGTAALLGGEDVG